MRPLHGTTRGAGVLGLLGLLGGCSTTPRAREAPPAPAAATTSAGPAEADSTYGYSQANPIKVGGFGEDQPARRQHEYLRALRGPGGQVVRYERRGSCCIYSTPNGMMGRGMLDVYEVTYEGLAAPVVLYLTLYDFEAPRAPRGFTLGR